MNYPIVVYPCEEGGFVAEIPALKGCLAQGETLEETLQELIIVRNLWLETAEKYGQKLPDIEGAIAKVKALSSVWILESGFPPIKGLTGLYLSLILWDIWISTISENVDEY